MRKVFRIHIGVLCKPYLGTGQSRRSCFPIRVVWTTEVLVSCSSLLRDPERVQLHEGPGVTTNSGRQQRRQ